MKNNPLRFPLILSVVAAVLTVGIKTIAYFLTGSVSLLSDALESLINLVTAVVAYQAIRYASRPVDSDHTYGHSKIEFFSSGLEGGLILLAAGGIAWTAVDHLLVAKPLQPLGLGLSLSLLASLINAATAYVLLRMGKKHDSIVLEASGRHLMTDVWTSVGVILGLGLVMLTNWEVLDPLIALVVATHILWVGFDLLRRSFDGLMDHALPDTEVEFIRRTIRDNLEPNMHSHALRTRKAGPQRFADFHLLVPGRMRVQEAHDLGERIVEAIQVQFPGIEITFHIEPIEDSQSWHDSELLAVEPSK